MKKKIKKYLSSKDRSAYSELDTILDMYISGQLKKLLSSYDGVGIYPTFDKHGKSIQINYNFHNIYVTVDFFEDNYNLVVYQAGINADDLEKLFTDYDYHENFDLKLLIDEIDVKLKNHPQLRDTTSIKKKKKYILSLPGFPYVCRL